MTTEAHQSAEAKDVKLYTMRDLRERAADVIAEINKSGVPGVITHHGRLIALITPLMGKHLEGRLIAEALRSSGEKDAALLGKEKVLSTQEVALRLGVKLPETEEELE
ncbi:hypothetical protein [Streptomyces afghaniensis]|uniref:hypothetical protein n=1 Tax=Streptomyces afghaniensis TaxID=66865 RepID=UPI002783AC9A|nr:hypothetical protein [Streptomyces afghaniensis]MDQ1018317.1 antitoxin (DNA-binding transcriptional repressor) of toxin-antitoxin stability system [Streptomyces afghaniensis]